MYKKNLSQTAPYARLDAFSTNAIYTSPALGVKTNISYFAGKAGGQVPQLASVTACVNG